METRVPLDYSAAGVDISRGDRASRLAFEHARNTFGFRQGRAGQALHVDGVFTGLIDVGPFYLALNSDGVGSKSVVAQAMECFDTLGHDLLAMVADDAACAGAEPMALVNTLDAERVDPDEVDALMRGLEEACRLASVSVVGGEIAELPDQARGFSWGAALVGLLRKDRVLGPSRVRPGQDLVGLLTTNFRSNGFTLLRRVLERMHGPEWVHARFEDGRSWGEVALEPSFIFTPFLNRLTGGFSGEPAAPVAALAHITGGGLEHNVGRVIPPGCTIRWGTLPASPRPMACLIESGHVEEREARRVWNMGIGMVIVTDDANAVLALAESLQVPATLLGKVAAS